MAPVSIDLIKDRLTGRIDELVLLLFPNASKDGREWRLGSISGEPGTSLGIRRTGHKAGWWKDFSSGEGGDVIDLIAHANVQGLRGDGDVGGAIGWAKRWLNLDVMDQAERGRLERKAERQRKEAANREAAEQADGRRRALGHFLSGQPIRGTPAEDYLVGRHIDFARLGRYPAALRYKEMKCPETGEMRPCLICAVSDPQGGVMTIHRIFLHRQLNGLWTHAGQGPDAPMRKAKKAYGAYQGGFISCWRGEGNRAISAGHDPQQWIAVTEGIEDALTIAMVRPDLRVLAAISLSNMGNVQTPACAGLYLCADNDTHPDAIRQFDAAFALQQQRGLAGDYPVRIVRPPEGVKDFNAWAKLLAAKTATLSHAVA